MYKKLFWLLLFNFLLLVNIKAQKKSYVIDNIVSDSVIIDSLLQDSLVAPAKNTITPRILLMPDSASKQHYIDSLKKGFAFEVLNLNKLLNSQKPTTEFIEFQKGNLLPKGEVWILGIIFFLLVLFAVLKNTFSKQLMAVVQSFFSNRALNALNKEENLLTSWPFLLLFIQFGFTIGMFFYLLAQYKGIEEVAGGFQFFVAISISIIVLYLLKIVILRILGFIFDMQKPLNEYISILYLSYFNASLLFIPLVIAFALSPAKYGSLYMAIGIILLSIIFAFQFIRAGINILSQYRFPKLYLFLYFCTLEICPILILIKAIGL